MIPTLQDRLDNWSRWARAYAMPHNRCASAEGRYVPPKLTDEGAEERSYKGARDPIDYTDAELIEQAISRIPRSAVRMFIHHWFLKKSPIKRLCKLFHIRAHLLDTLLRQCLADLELAVRQVEHTQSLAIRRKVLYNLGQMTDIPSKTSLLPAAAG